MDFTLSLTSYKIAVYLNMLKDFIMKNRLSTVLTVALLMLAVYPCRQPARPEHQSATCRWQRAGNHQKTRRNQGGNNHIYPVGDADKNGALVGYEIDVARRLAEDMGVKAEFAPTAWDGDHSCAAARQVRPDYLVCRWNVT